MLKVIFYFLSLALFVSFLTSFFVFAFNSGRENLAPSTVGTLGVVLCVSILITFFLYRREVA